MRQFHIFHSLVTPCRKPLQKLCTHLRKHGKILSKLGIMTAVSSNTVTACILCLEVLHKNGWTGKERNSTMNRSIGTFHQRSNIWWPGEQGYSFVIFHHSLVLDLYCYPKYRIHSMPTQFFKPKSSVLPFIGCAHSIPMWKLIPFNSVSSNKKTGSPKPPIPPPQRHEMVEKSENNQWLNSQNYPPTDNPDI